MRVILPEPNAAGQARCLGLLTTEGQGKGAPEGQQMVARSKRAARHPWIALVKNPRPVRAQETIWHPFMVRGPRKGRSPVAYTGVT